MLILDTDHFSILRRNPERLEERLVASGEDVVISIVTVEEAMRGWLAQIHKARVPREELEPYERFFRFVRSLDNWQILPMDEDCVRIWENLKAQRVRIGTMDLKIASTTIAYGAKLLSRNLRDFQRVPDLDVEDWIG